METITTAQQVTRSKNEYIQHNAKEAAFREAASIVSGLMADSVHRYFENIECNEDKAAANVLWMIRAQDEIREKILDRADAESDAAVEAHDNWEEYEHIFEEEQRKALVK